MFNSIDIAIWKAFKGAMTKLIPAFDLELVGIPLGSLLFDVTVILAIALTVLSKVNRNAEKVKK